MKEIMKNDNLAFEEKQLANILRQEVLKSSQSYIEPAKTNNIEELEMISSSKIEQEQYVSPIFSMNEDQILAFVEEFDVNELATLSVAELNHIGQILGVDPKILIEG